MQTVIINLDVVCFDAPGRLEGCRKEGGIIDWKKGFSNEQIVVPRVIGDAIAQTWQIYGWYQIAYITGRSDVCVTGIKVSLFINNNFAPGMVCTRGDGDFRPDRVVKYEIINRLREENGVNFVAAIDDNYSGELKSMFVMYESLGIPCFTSFDEFFDSDVWQ